MGKVHWFMGNKGGVGKSLAALLMAQYCLAKGQPVVCIDADTTNATLRRYKAIRASSMALVNEQNHVEPWALQEALSSAGDTMVLDSASGGFGAILKGFSAGQLGELLAAPRYQLVAHCIITAGLAFHETVAGLLGMIVALPREAELVVWLNEHFGSVQDQGVPFEESKVYNDCRGRISGLVRIPQQSTLFERDFRWMLERGLTFAEAIAHPELFAHNRQRLVMIRRAMFEQLALVL